VGTYCTEVQEHLQQGWLSNIAVAHADDEIRLRAQSRSAVATRHLALPRRCAAGFGCYWTISSGQAEDASSIFCFWRDFRYHRVASDA